MAVIRRTRPSCWPPVPPSRQPTVSICHTSLLPTFYFKCIDEGRFMGKDHILTYSNRFPLRETESNYLRLLHSKVLQLHSERVRPICWVALFTDALFLRLRRRAVWCLLRTRPVDSLQFLRFRVFGSQFSWKKCTSPVATQTPRASSSPLHLLSPLFSRAALELVSIFTLNIANQVEWSRFFNCLPSPCQW